MKPSSSPASLLLLLLSLTTAFPVPSAFSKECLHYTTYQSWLRETFSPSNNDHTPPTRFPTSPHFPEHQLNPPSSSAETYREIEEDFNNTPLTPTKDQAPTLALSATRPLLSSYLLSLSNPLPTVPKDKQPDQSTSVGTVADALPAKPTSALPRLREEDTLRYWATIANPPSENPADVRFAGEGSGCASMAKSTILKVGQPIVLAREYSDLVVVGIVVLFLAAVVVMEAVEYFGDLRFAIHCRDRRRGEIFLPDDETKCSVKKQVSLQPTPTRYDTGPGLSEDVEKGEYQD